MTRIRPRRLDDDDVDRQLAQLPGVHRDRIGSLTVGLRAPSFAAAVQLISLVAAEAEAMDHHPDVDLRWCDITFGLSTHSAGGITQFDIELAHRILEVGREVSATPSPAPQRVEVALDVLDADAVRDFWRIALDYRVSGPELVDPRGRGPVLWFQQLDQPRPQRNRFHLDVYVPEDQVAARITDCLVAGGRVIDESHAPAWIVLADAEGNEVCLCTRSHPASDA